MSVRSNSIRLYTDEDVDGRLATALSNRGYDVLSCHQAGNSGHGHSDEWQLTFATGVERVILTHNIGDYTLLARRWNVETRVHFGILLVNQIDVSELIARMTDFLMSAEPPDIHNMTLWLP
jgi:predicted nuclease of predicted toxin-antitoxin system